jgi:beta-glucosidase
MSVVDHHKDHRIEAAGHSHAGLDYLNELPQARPHIHETRRFPDGFLWGTATAAHQVEGNNTKNDWWRWEGVKGHIAEGMRSGDACDHYRRYEQDFDIAADVLANNAHRLSIEWSRIEPEEGKWDMDEVLHYRRVLEALRRRGLSPMLTLWHFTLPQWFAERGGWESAGAVRSFERYAAFIARELGDLVDLWCTINEPMIYLTQSYATGAWPPGIASPLRSVRVFGVLTRAHVAAYRAIHKAIDTKERKAVVGIAKNVITFEPYRQYNVIDNAFIYLADRFFNRQFFIWTRNSHDYIGINYYFHYRVKGLPSRSSGLFYEVHTENREVNDLGWEINPQGIFDAIMSMSRYKKPIYITENGIANGDDGKRPRVLIATIKEVYHAIQAGADVRGYFHWSLLDNFEWHQGFHGRFGLVAIEYMTQKRTPRRSAYVYAEIARENGVPHRLLKFMGHGIRW